MSITRVMPVLCDRFGCGTRADYQYTAVEDSFTGTPISYCTEHLWEALDHAGAVIEPDRDFIKAAARVLDARRCEGCNQWTPQEDLALTEHHECVDCQHARHHENSEEVA